MKMLLDSVIAAERILKSLGVRDVALDIAPPADLGLLQAAEARLGREFPAALRRVFLSEAGGLRLCWNANAFGPDCTRGDAWLLSPSEIVQAFESQAGIADDARMERLDVEDDGYRALVRDWPLWLPVFRFPSGDCFCLEVGKGWDDPAVVFLEHDVMDQGPNLHGLLLAPNLPELVSHWSAVLFTDVSDWSKAVAAGGGIDASAEVFRPLREAVLVLGP